jgi:inhibitor of KinA sporulation pathway (predicted exonuclease)
MTAPLKKILIIDLESTCFEGMPRSEQNQITEIIEIGITEVNTIKKHIIRTDSWLVKPQKTAITDYCTKLTGISDLMVQEKGLSLQDVSNLIIN